MMLTRIYIIQMNQIDIFLSIQSLTAYADNAPFSQIKHTANSSTNTQICCTVCVQNTEVESLFGLRALLLEQTLGVVPEPGIVSKAQQYSLVGYDLRDSLLGCDV